MGYSNWHPSHGYPNTWLVDFFKKIQEISSSFVLVASVEFKEILTGFWCCFCLFAVMEVSGHGPRAKLAETFDCYLSHIQRNPTDL